MFFNPIVNAARGIAVQVQGLATVLASNFQQAVDPQITKNYATSDNLRMLSLIYKSTKISYILVFLNRVAREFKKDGIYSHLFI